MAFVMFAIGANLNLLSKTDVYILHCVELVS